MKKFVIAVSFLSLVSTSAFAKRVSQDDLLDVESRLNQKITKLELDLQALKEQKRSTINIQSEITPIVDLLEANNIDFQITSQASDKLLKTNNAGIIKACMLSYLAAAKSGAKRLIYKVSIKYGKADNDIKVGYPSSENILAINVKYWGDSSNTASTNPELKATECFEVAYTNFIK